MKKICIEDLIQTDLGLVDGYIEQLANETNQLYRKRGIKGRTIYVPSPELKLIQCWVSDFLHAASGDLPEYVAAYEPGCSIKRNALLHAKSNHILTLDISNFFPSCTRELVEKVFSTISVVVSPAEGARKLRDNEVTLLSKLSCYKNSLCIGAPSSPAIANRILLDFDKEVRESLRSDHVYSRYSDDITISSENWIDKEDTISIVREKLACYGFRLNESKTRCIGRGNRRKITGVYIQPNGCLSIGKKLKSNIKHELYRFLVYGIGNSAHILGQIHFARYIDPDWTSGLLAKYNQYGSARGRGVIKALEESGQFPMK